MVYLLWAVTEMHLPGCYICTLICAGIKENFRKDKEKEVIPLFQEYEWKVLLGWYQFMQFSKWLDLTKKKQTKKNNSSSTEG